MSKTLSIRKKKCIICGRPAHAKNSRYCLRCSKFAIRLRRLPHKTAKYIWDYVRKYGYICYYTKMPLDVTHPRSPWYCVFSHRNPRDPEGKVVITSALLCAMKSGLSEKDFWYFILQLADYKEKHIKVRKKKLAFRSTLV